DAARAFEQLAAADPRDAAAQYNLGLARAWLGNNRGAVEALDPYVALEAEESKAGAAWALAEVLRCGHGLEDDADYVEHSAIYQVMDPRPLNNFLQELSQERRLVGVQSQEQAGIVTGLLLERRPALTPELAAAQPPHLG